MKTTTILFFALLFPLTSIAKGPPAVTFEPTQGSNLKRVILTPKAAERLGIQTAKVSEAAIVRTQMVSGLVVPSAAAQKQVEPAPLARGFGPGFNLSPAVAPQQTVLNKSAVPSGAAWVQVSLTAAEWERLARDKPVRLLPLATRGQPTATAVLAVPTGLQPVEDMKRSMISVYYVLPQGEHGHAMNKRMRVELPLAGAEGARKIVPYSALYYDARGNAWVYVTPRPLAYERQRVVVEQVAGEFAALSEGPALGAEVVSTGASLLYGTEIFGK